MKYANSASYNNLNIPYNWHPKRYRLLWHQTLDQLLRYPEIPEKTLNFDLYPVIKKKVNRQITLSSTVLTTHLYNIEDTIVTEFWTADNISIKTGFFYAFKHFFENELAADDFLVWFPKDKTDKAFLIEPIDLIIGSEDETSLNPIGDYDDRDFRWLIEEVRFVFRILKLFDPPQASVTLEGA